MQIQRTHHAVELEDGWAFVETNWATNGGIDENGQPSLTAVHTPIGECANHAPHATEDEARACYAEVLRSQIQLTGRRPVPDTFDVCRVCGTDTDRFAWLATVTNQAALCPEHMNVDVAAALLIGPLAGNTTHA